MKKNHYIAALDWNSLSSEEQLKFKNYLQFIGIDTFTSVISPDEYVTRNKVILVSPTKRLLACSTFYCAEKVRYTIEEIKQDIELSLF